MFFWARMEKMITFLTPVCLLITELETNTLLPDSILTKSEEKDIFKKLEERAEKAVGAIH